MAARKILFLMRQPPYASSRALEALESTLVAAVFDQEVAVLFKDDGVWQLVPDQNGSLLGTRTISKVATALPEYDVDKLYVCADSLAARRLQADNLALPVIGLTTDEQQALIAAQHVVMND